MNWVSRLVEQLFTWLGEFVVGWAIPLFLAAIIIPVLQILVLANHIAGGFVIFIIGILLIVSAGRLQQWRQLGVWVSTFSAAVLLAFFWPVYYHLWALFLEVVVLVILLAPGVMFTKVRSLFVGLLIAEILLTVTLMAGAVIGASVPLLVLALLAVGGGYLLYRHGARPLDLRRFHRKTSKAIIGAGVLLLIISFAAPKAVSKKVNEESLIVSILPQPLKTWYYGLSQLSEAKIQGWLRKNIVEKTKTNVLEEKKQELKAKYAEIYNKGIKDLSYHDLYKGIQKELH